jgi:hypothetical protein
MPKFVHGMEDICIEVQQQFLEAIELSLGKAIALLFRADHEVSVAGLGPAGIRKAGGPT